MGMKVMIMGMKAMLLLVLVSINAIKSVHGGTVTCGDAISTLDPCLPFLEGSESTPDESCCLGVQRLSIEAYSKEIRRQLCECFEKAAPHFGVKDDKAKQLPDLCHVEVPVPIDLSIDCNKIEDYIA